MAEGNNSPRIIVCKDQQGKVTLLTQRALRQMVKKGKGLVVTTDFAGEGEEEGSREILYTGDLFLLMHRVLNSSSRQGMEAF